MRESPTSPEALRTGLVLLLASCALSACGAGDQSLTERIDQEIQEQGESKNFAMKLESCASRGEDRYVCSFWVAERLPKVNYIAPGELKCLTRSLAEARARRCHEEQPPEYSTSRGLMVLTIDTGGDRVRVVGTQRPVPYPLTGDLRRTLERRYPAELFPADWEDPRGLAPNPG